DRVRGAQRVSSDEARGLRWCSGLILRDALRAPQDEGMGHGFSFSRRDSPEVCSSLRSLRNQRAQGKPDASPSGSLAYESWKSTQASVTTGSAEHPAFPARRTSTAYACSARRPTTPPSPHETSCDLPSGRTTLTSRGLTPKASAPARFCRSQSQSAVTTSSD